MIMKSLRKKSGSGPDSSCRDSLNWFGQWPHRLAVDQLDHGNLTVDLNDIKETGCELYDEATCITIGQCRTTNTNCHT